MNKELFMNDKEKIMALLESADVEYDEWNEHLIVLDNAYVEIHFNSDGKLLDIIAGDGDKYV